MTSFEAEMRFNLRDSETRSSSLGKKNIYQPNFLKRSFPLRGLFAVTCSTEFIVSSDSASIQNRAACLQLNREERVAATEQ